MWFISCMDLEFDSPRPTPLAVFFWGFRVGGLGFRGVCVASQEYRVLKGGEGGGIQGG